MFVKRITDITLSITGLLLSVPLCFCIIPAIKLTSKGPVFFRQERAGKDGKVFMIYKFRTMVNNAVQMGAGHKVVVDDPRITRPGRFLRRTSLDELPQLFNVLKGEMSLIGPRPTLLYQVNQYNERQKVRLRMKPGITGWAQVNGRNGLTWPDRIELDVWYVENWSLLLDLLILFRTIAVVLKREGIYRDQSNMKSKES